LTPVFPYDILYELEVNEMTPRFNGKRLADARNEASLSQPQLANEAGVSRGAIAAYEGGENVPGANVLASMALTLGKPWEYFFTEEVQNSFQPHPLDRAV
jgi:transcriptional regulator with XRE-family HTH domain